MNFPNTFAEGMRMVGMSKNVAEGEVKFSVLSCDSDSMADGSSCENIFATNNETEEHFEFLLMRNSLGKVSYCNRFSSVAKIWPLV